MKKLCFAAFIAIVSLVTFSKNVTAQTVQNAKFYIDTEGVAVKNFEYTESDDTAAGVWTFSPRFHVDASVTSAPRLFKTADDKPRNLPATPAVKELFGLDDVMSVELTKCAYKVSYKIGGSFSADDAKTILIHKSYSSVLKCRKASGEACH